MSGKIYRNYLFLELRNSINILSKEGDKLNGWHIKMYIYGDHIKYALRTKELEG